MNRRSFITGMAGILSAGYAPALVGSSVLMPVRKLNLIADGPPSGLEMSDDDFYYFDGYYFHKTGQEMIITTGLQTLARWD